MPTFTMRVSHPRDIAEALEGLKRVNMAQMVRHGLPPLYRSGVVYEREFPREEWRTYLDVLKAGSGDCEDLAGIRAAELTLSGVPASPALYRTKSGGWHAVVVRLDTGTILDPSRELGM